MDLKFRVSGRIDKPVHEVFEAVADPTKLSSYFTTAGAVGRIETGAVVTWDFADFPGAFPVQVVEVEQDKKIVLLWDANDGEPPSVAGGEHKAAPYKTRVTMNFTGLDDGRTLVEIFEEGWRETQTGLAASYGNCQGWAQMLCAMKAWLEYGLNIRKGMYK